MTAQSTQCFPTSLSCHHSAHTQCNCLFSIKPLLQLYSSSFSSSYGSVRLSALCFLFSKSRRDADKFVCTLVTWSSDVFMSKIPDPLSLLYGCRGGGGSSSCIRHLSLAQGDGQLQVFLLLLSQPLQPLTLCSLTLSLSPFQLLSLIPELHTTEQQREWQREVPLITWNLHHD